MGKAGMERVAFAAPKVYQKGPVGYRRRNLCPSFENSAHCGPFSGSMISYSYLVGADRSRKYKHGIVFNGDKFVKLPYRNKENVEILDVNDPRQGPFLESIEQKKWPRGFPKKEGVHMISITGLYPCQDLLKFIGLGPSPVSESDDESDDDMDIDSDDDMLRRRASCKKSGQKDSVRGSSHD